MEGGGLVTGSQAEYMSEDSFWGFLWVSLPWHWPDQSNFSLLNLCEDCSGEPSKGTIKGNLLHVISLVPAFDHFQYAQGTLGAMTTSDSVKVAQVIPVVL